MIPEIEPGTIIHSRYQIQKLLGQGGFGRTYLAFDNQRFNEACVLKEFVPTASQEKNICKYRELFKREAKVLYQIEHPQIPKFLAWFMDNQRIFIVQEYIDGKTYSEILCDRIAQNGQPFSEVEVRTWLMDILPVLEYLHERKIIHRDISLDNMMLPHNQSKPVLIDFGVVKENFTRTIPPDSPTFDNSIHNLIVGRFGYSPPEQLRLGHSYPSSDIYALGVCAVVLLTGKKPHLLLDESLNWQWRSQVNICNYFAIIIEKMLAEVPKTRFQSAKEILVILNEYVNNSPALPSLKFPIVSQIKGIKNYQKRKHEKKAQKALEELLILQDLERELRQSDPTDSNAHPQSPIYLGLNLPEYIEQKLSDIETSTHNAIGQKIAEKVTSILAVIVSKIVVNNSESNYHIKSKINIHEFIENSPVNSNLELLEIIQQEFTNYIGPIASFLINEIVVTFSDCPPKKLIEILADEIPDRLIAQQFKEDIYNIIKSKFYLVQGNE